MSALRAYLFTVAQIFNLPYRRFVIGRTLLAGDISQVKNLRCSRLQVCATAAANTLNTYPELRRDSFDRRCRSDVRSARYHAGGDGAARHPYHIVRNKYDAGSTLRRAWFFVEFPRSNH